jgi:LemA protein
MNRKLLFGCGGLVVLLLLIVFIFGGWFVRLNNNMVQKQQAVDAQWAQVQNVYQRRSDLVPQLVGTVQGAADFEKNTLQKVTEARASVGRLNVDAQNAPTTAAELQKFQEAQTGLSSALSRLLVVVERYPDLKANSNFLNLQSQLEGTENRISVERMRFNEITRDYNSFIAVFPNNLVAGFRGFTHRPYFQAEEKAQQAPEVKFDFQNRTE